eukprot:jgi/Mesvir1/12140/Mv00393-RA.1
MKVENYLLSRILSAATQKALLMIGNVEVNPGPSWEQDEVAKGLDLQQFCDVFEEFDCPAEGGEKYGTEVLSVSKMEPGVIANLKRFAFKLAMFNERGPNKGEPSVSQLLKALGNG